MNEYAYMCVKNIAEFLLLLLEEGGISIPPQGLNLGPLHRLRVQSLNHWTTREIPSLRSFVKTFSK